MSTRRPRPTGTKRLGAAVAGARARARKPAQGPELGRPTLEVDPGVEDWNARFLDLDEEPEQSPDEAGHDRMAAGLSSHEEAWVRVPLIALVGRPNVGKSRLFNRLTGTRHAIVEDMPGVTRDRQYGEGEWDGRLFHVVDTGGFEPHTEDVLLTQMKEQAQLAMEEADIIFFMVDGPAGVMPADRDIASLLRGSAKSVILVVNKIDGPKHDGLAGEFHALGVHDVVPVSAEHGRDVDLLMERVLHLMPRASEVEASLQGDLIKVAVIGRPNAGKSTLVNRLLGAQRLLTSDIPGTTRDAVHTLLTRGDRQFLLIDTAGVRRKRSISQLVEKYSVVQAFKAIDRADVVLYVLDAGEGVTTQDQRVCGLAHDKGRAMVLLLNKWDTIEKDHRTADAYVRGLRDTLKFSRYAPVLTVSAKTGQRVHRVLDIAAETVEAHRRRVSTGELNRFLREVVDRNPPPTKGRRRLKLFYMTQVSHGPPTFMIAVNYKDLLHFSYERYVLNAMRERFGFEGTPLKVFYREREQRERDDTER